MWVEIDKVLAAAIAAQKLQGESREKTVRRLLLKALAADSAAQSPAVRVVRPKLTPRAAAKAVAVTASANRSVTAVELAKELSWDPKRLRRWLRYAANAGHPLLSTHEHRESWVFTGREADQLRVEALHGPWQASYNWQGMVPTTTPPILSSQSELTAAISAADVARELRTLRRTSAGRLSVAQVPPCPGLYAWWHAPGVLPEVTHAGSGPTLSVDGTFELAYVGIAGSLHGRLVGDHLGGSTGKSTLRRALGAWLGAEQGWLTEWRSDRVQHDTTSELALTTWMKQNLQVTWVKHGSPHDVEADVIALLRPPLNHQFNRSHPNWSALDAARRTWRGQAR